MDCKLGEQGMATVSNRTRIGYQQATERALTQAPGKPADLSLPKDQYWFEELLDASIRADLLAAHHLSNCTRSNRALGMARMAVWAARNELSTAWRFYRQAAPSRAQLATSAAA